MQSQEIEDRLIIFAATAINICQSLLKSNGGQILSNQFIKSSTSSALNYGEAKGAELRKELVHKMGIVLKKLRETLIGLKIFRISGLSKNSIAVENGIKENNELVSIFVAV
jgi:four helix bundle protein